MTENTQYIPKGFHAVLPHMCVRDIAEAIAFYQHVFGATEIERLVVPGGRTVHAEIKIGDSPISLSEEDPNNHNHSPLSLGGSTVAINLYVEDVDATFDRAIAAGSKVLFPVGNQFYGDRSGRLADPFGHMWMIATHQEDVSPEEMQKRFEA